MTHTTNFPHSSETTDHLRTPGDLMAAVPGVLGFYPHESVIIVGLHADASGESLSLGPVIRVDIPHWQELRQAMAIPTAAECEVFFAFVVTRTPDTPEVHTLVDSLYTLVDNSGDALIQACWILSEIATGSHFDLCFGEIPEEWARGSVPCIALSPAMQPMLDNGGLPALTRDDAIDYFAPILLDDEARDTIDGVTQLAYCHGQQLHGRIEQQLPGPAEAVADADRALSQAPQQPLVAPYDQPLHEAFHGEEGEGPVNDDVLAVMTCLSRSRLRDSIVSTALREPQRAATILVYIARISSGVIRANALSVWAIVAISAGLHSWATAALKSACAELKGHGLSSALLDALALGGHAELLSAVVAGSKEQREMLSLPV